MINPNDESDELTRLARLAVEASKKTNEEFAKDPDAVRKWAERLANDLSKFTD